MTEKQMVDEICKILDDKKATDIQVIDLQEKTVIADYFVICSGRSSTHVRSLSDNLDEEMSKLGVEPIRLEGKQEGRWAVIDYGDVIVHIFYEETRKTYELEQLWSDGNNIKIISNKE